MLMAMDTVEELVRVYNYMVDNWNKAKEDFDQMMSEVGAFQTMKDCPEELRSHIQYTAGLLIESAKHVLRTTNRMIQLGIAMPDHFVNAEPGEEPEELNDEHILCIKSFPKLVTEEHRELLN
jgi:hypothetical protein